LLAFGSALVYVIPTLIIAITLHEFAHAWTSWKLGDYRAKESGRITLNPIKHLDVFGLLMLFAIGFGWAKPVMVNPEYYKKPGLGMMLVAIAGPATNFALAIIGILLSFVLTGEAFIFAVWFWVINLNLGIFNLFPIPPLDGSKIFGFFVHGDDYMDFLQYERYGFFVLIIMAVFGVFGMVIGPINTFLLNFLYG